MQTNTSHSCLRPFRWCVVLFLISTQGWGQECISGNCINGQSTITYDGGKYVGEYKDGKWHGQGTLTSANGTKYVGEFKDDAFNGQGTFTYPDGTKYVGEFKDNNYNGQGILTYPDGSEYVGEFKDDAFNGQGTYTYPDGTKYVGEFKDNNYNGQGILTYPDGSEYVGEFKDDKRHGHGTHTLPPPWGNVEAGIWEKDNFIETFEDKSRRERIYNACILDESDGVDMSVRSLEMAVRETCTEISKNPSWLDGFRYD